MTQEEALTLIRSSAHYKNAGGEVREMIVSFVRKNPGEARRIAAYLTSYAHGEHAPLPVEQTLVARGIVGLLPTLPAPPPPAPTRTKGALVVNATACVPDWFRQAGISHVAFDLTAGNMTDAAHRATRWHGFTLGGLFISRGGDTHNEVPHAASIVKDNGLAFLVCDTESHKADMGGSLDWTERLYSGLSWEFGPSFPLVNVTFGIHSSPAVVNHDALRRHNVKAVWEAYDGAGRTLGVNHTAIKANEEGWRPAHVAIGDKSIEFDVGTIRMADAASLPVGDVWVWAPEQAGEAILELAKVPA